MSPVLQGNARNPSLTAYSPCRTGGEFCRKVKNMRNFSNILNEFQSGNVKNVEIVLTKEQAEQIFGDNVVRKEVGILLVSIRWQDDLARIRITKLL